LTCFVGLKSELASWGSNRYLGSADGWSWGEGSNTRECW